LARTKKRRVERPREAPRPERERDGKQQLKPQKRRQERAPKQPRPIEETLFFSRLRRQAKWVFVLLAIAFAGTFVIFGVGSGGSGLGDVLFLGDGGAGGAPSVGDAQEKIDDDPQNAAAYYELSQAYQAEGETDEAIDALEQYTALRPKDVEKLNELAGLYLAEGNQAQQRAQIAQAETQLVTGGGLFTTQLQGEKDAAVDLGPGTGVEDAVSSVVSEEFSEHLTAMTTAYAQAQASYEQVVELTPNDPTALQNLALAAQQANDIPAAIDAFEKFLKLAPDDPSAGLIREQLKQLKASQPAASSG
jgi:tetratricopeptide (TPR) repeat protein